MGLFGYFPFPTQNSYSDCTRTEHVFVNPFRSPEIDSQPGGIDSWAPLTFTNTGSNWTKTTPKKYIF